MEVEIGLGVGDDTRAAPRRFGDKTFTYEQVNRLTHGSLRDAEAPGPAPFNPPTFNLNAPKP